VSLSHLQSGTAFRSTLAYLVIQAYSPQNFLSCSRLYRRPLSVRTPLIWLSCLSFQSLEFLWFAPSRLFLFAFVCRPASIFMYSFARMHSRSGSAVCFQQLSRRITDCGQACDRNRISMDEVAVQTATPNYYCSRNSLPITNSSLLAVHIYTCTVT
jgi:hypothetical protein